MIQAGPMAKRKNPQRILYLGERRNNAIVTTLKRAGFAVATLHTLDHGVAFTVHNPVDLVILDQAIFIEVDGWSPAQSFKLVKPNICIVVMTTSEKFGNGLPIGVDAFIHKRSNLLLVAAVKRLLAHTKAIAAKAGAP